MLKKFGIALGIVMAALVALSLFGLLLTRPISEERLGELGVIGPDSLYVEVDGVRTRYVMQGDADEVLDALHHMRYRGHDVILFQVLDETEVRFPFDHVSRFEDPETKQTLTAHPDAIRQAYTAALGAFTERYRKEAAALRFDFVQVDTSMTFDRALVQFLIDRQHKF